MDGCTDWVTHTLTKLYVISLCLFTPFVYIAVQVLWAAGWPKKTTDNDEENDEEAVKTDGDRNALLNTHSTMTGYSTPSQSASAV